MVVVAAPSKVLFVFVPIFCVQGMPSTPSSVPARPSLMPWMPKQVAPESSGPIVEVQAEGYDGFADGPMTLFDCLATVFGLVERLYKDFDQDGTGDIPFSQMLFQFKFKGLKVWSSRTQRGPGIPCTTLHNSVSTSQNLPPGGSIRRGACAVHILGLFRRPFQLI